MLFGCTVAQKLYGREPESMAAAGKVFHAVLAPYPGDKVNLALRTWLERSSEFPTPADLVGLIERNGRPPIRESDVIAIRKKDGELRTADEWAVLRQWDEEQRRCWEGSSDTVKDQAQLAELNRLREEVVFLRGENARLGEVLQIERARGRRTDAAEVPLPDKIQRTVDYLRSTGSTQAEVDAFLDEAKEAVARR